MRGFIFAIILVCSVVLQSCYTAGYSTLGGNYFQRYSNDTLYYESNMEKFAQNHPDLMLDSALVNKSFKNVYFDLPQKQHIQSGRYLYPLFPIKDWNGLSSWYFKSPDQQHIYKIGLFNCRFDNPKHNACSFSLQAVYKLVGQELQGIALYKKENKAERESYLRKFEDEILPIMKPYFVFEN